MKKIKIFLDTSVVSHLDHKDTPEKMEQTHELWEILKRNKYNVVIGQTVIEELEECKEPKKGLLYDYLADINYDYIENTDEIYKLAQEIVDFGILKKKNFDDCLNIATAILTDCNIIVSWNYKHMVNVETINGIRTITLAKRYNTIDIYPPNLLLEGDNEDE